MEKLINTVQDLRAQLGMKELSNPRKIGRKKLEEMHTKLMMEVTVSKVEVEPTKEKKVVQTETIKDLSCRLLSEIDHTNEEGRTVGRPYQDILDDILKQRPEAKTSLNCLRWYAGRIRGSYAGFQMYSLPQIRARKVKA